MLKGVSDTFKGSIEALEQHLKDNDPHDYFDEEEQEWSDMALLQILTAQGYARMPDSQNVTFVEVDMRFPFHDADTCLPLVESTFDLKVLRKLSDYVMNFKNNV